MYDWKLNAHTFCTKVGKASARKRTFAVPIWLLHFLRRGTKQVKLQTTDSQIIFRRALNLDSSGCFYCLIFTLNLADLPMRSQFTRFNLHLDTTELFLLYRHTYISRLNIEISENGKCCVLNHLFITSYSQLNWSLSVP